MSDFPDPSRSFFRSQSATSGYRHDARSKYSEYLKKLEEKNQTSKAYHSEQKSKDDILKQRESGFQLYINGVHNKLPPRSSSASRKRLDSSSNRIETLSPLYSNFTSTNLTKKTRQHRGQWMPAIQTKIKTEQGSILTDIHCQISKSQPSVNNQLTYRLMSPPKVDQSWMPDWFRNTKSNSQENSDIQQSLSLSLEHVSTAGLINSQQQTYRLSTPVGR